MKKVFYIVIAFIMVLIGLFTLCLFHLIKAQSICRIIYE